MHKDASAHRKLSVAFGGLLVSGLILAPAAHADACDNLKTARAVQACKMNEKNDPNIGDEQRQVAQNDPQQLPPDPAGAPANLSPDAGAIAGGMQGAPPIPADAPQVAQGKNPFGLTGPYGHEDYPPGAGPPPPAAPPPPVVPIAPAPSPAPLPGSDVWGPDWPSGGYR
jgi:hypothetical protein